MARPRRCNAPFPILLALLVAGTCLGISERPATAQAAPDGGAGDGATATATVTATADGGTADGGAAPGLSAEEQRQLEEALKADAASQKKGASGGAAQVNSDLAAGTTAAPGSVVAPTRGFGATLSRAWQSLNPDISAIVDFAGGFYDGKGIVKSGDDPGDTGANLQEVELAFSATVDPYFRGEVYLTIPNLSGLEVEEAFLTTTSLPGSLQIRAGIFRAPFGRQNTQHLHLQQFTRRPQMNALFLGADGLRSPGAEVSWLIPVPFYLLVTGAAFSVAAPEDPGVYRSFGGGSRKDLTYLANLRTFADLNDSTSLLLGASFATGLSGYLDPTTRELAPPTRTYLYGADAYLRWKPANQAKTYMSVAWTTEFYLRHVPDRSAVDGALYSQVVWQVARRWFLGVRGEVDGIPATDVVPRQYAGSGSITWALSEFSRVRIHGEGRYTPGTPAAVSGLGPGWSSSVFLQFEASIGAHGAHPY